MFNEWLLCLLSHRGWRTPRSHAHRSYFPTTDRLFSGRRPGYPEMPSPTSPGRPRQTVCFGCRRPAREWRACPCGSLKQKLLPDSLWEKPAHPSTYTDMSEVGCPVGRAAGGRGVHRLSDGGQRACKPGGRPRLRPGGNRAEALKGFKRERDTVRFVA